MPRSCRSWTPPFCPNPRCDSHAAPGTWRWKRKGFYERLRSELEAATSRRIVIERREDPELIGGVVTRIGDNTIDGSVRGQLAEIERSLRTN